MMNQRVFGCPVELALHLLGGKWKPVILARIKERPLRYRELRSSIPQLSDKVLTQRLDELVATGLVTTTVSRAVKFYQLSPRGESLRPVLQSLYDWGVHAAEEQDVIFRAGDAVSDAEKCGDRR